VVGLVVDMGMGRVDVCVGVGVGWGGGRTEMVLGGNVLLWAVSGSERK
jgi:hypothetical protein